MPTAASNRIYYYLTANSHCSLCHILPYYLKTTITIEWVLKHLCSLRFAKMLNLRELLGSKGKIKLETGKEDGMNCKHGGL